MNRAQVLIARETLPSQIAAYYLSEGHTRVNGVITPTDNGTTWSQPSLAVQTDHDARDPKVAKLADGTLLLSSFGMRWPASSTPPAAI